MSTPDRRGLVMMAYGTPRAAAEIEAYYTHIRRGRPPSADQLAELTGRYAAIGGVSPLAARTAAQVGAVTAALEAVEPGRWHVAQGNKHAAPFVEDAVGELVAVGADTITGLVLTPHFSQASVGEYHTRARAAAEGHGRDYAGVDDWHDDPAWIAAQVDRVRRARAGLPQRTHVLFTAHSLPERVLAGDPYPGQLAASAASIASGADLTGPSALPPGVGGAAGPWSLAWQSAGRTPEPWRGPDVLDVIRDLGASGAVDGVLVCPQGFVSDHLEVLYDLDIDARRVATENGLAFARTASINDEPTVMSALAARVRQVPVPT